MLTPTKIKSYYEKNRVEFGQWMIFFSLVALIIQNMLEH